MEQSDINQQIFARLTVQNALLEQITSSLLSTQPDHGDAFISDFVRNLRYKLNVPADANQESGLDALQLQEDALFFAERFFLSVRSRVSNP